MSFFAAVSERKVGPNREIRIGGEIFVAPDVARINQSIDVLSEGEHFFAVIGGKRYRLESQADYHKNHKYDAPEREEDMLFDREMRVRLDEEISVLSRGELNLKSMKISHEDDLRFFYEKAHSIAEIKTFAAQLVRERSILPDNIIRLPDPR